jgi:hypothetical protein
MKLATLEAIVGALNDENVRYLIVGGLAVAAHGYGRVTFDVDLVVQLQPENVNRAVDALETLGYRPLVPVSTRDFADGAIRHTWVQDKGMVVFQLHSEQHRDTRIDLFVIETLIRMKEAAGRGKDQEDVRQLRLLLGNPGDDE